MSGGAKKLIVLMTLLTVSAAMVYGTWLAVDDMRAKPMAAQVTIRHQGALTALEVVNTGDFTWHDATFTVNGRYRVAWPEPVEPGATLDLPLADFRDPAGVALPWPKEPVHEIAATTTRSPRFPRVNQLRVSTGRWPLG